MGTEASSRAGIYRSRAVGVVGTFEKHMAKRIQQYEIGKVIGKGDMSIVSLASLIRTNQLGEERKDPTPLAFKELQKDYALNASYRNRFLEEVTAYKQLNLPNAVEVLDVVMDQNTLAVVMPF